MLVRVKTPLYSTLIVAAGLSAWGMHAVADNDHGFVLPVKVHQVHALSGKYGWTTQQTCVNTVPSPPGTDAIDPNPPNKLNVPAEIVNMNGVGTATFKKDGTMHIDVGGTAVQIRHSQTSPGQQPVTSGFDPVCDGTYSIGPNNKAKVDWNCVISTPQPGLTIQAGPVNWDGYVADNGRLIDLNLKPTRQTLTFMQDGNPLFEVQRLCQQRFMFHKLPE